MTLVAEVDAHEGPVYLEREHALCFTSVRTDRVSIRRLDLRTGAITTLVDDANMANGMTLGHDGRLVVCEQGTLDTPARISRVEPRTGETETIVDAFGGLPLSSPNDVVVSRDTAIWFTDPSYGHLQGFRPAPALPDAVYRHHPATGSTTRVATGFDKPNGLVFSPDETILYVSDNGAPHHLLAFDVTPQVTLDNPRVVAKSTPEHPDGLAVDAAGNIYCSASTGIHVFSPAGELIDEIDLPGAVNFTFGGPERSVLYVTADSAVWAVMPHAKGA
ncbi:MAG: SMP-30/gluconolactonase/LRE family protein [Gaiella sp.]